MDASTGEIAGACVQATVTVTMHGPKVGNEIAPGRFRAGEVVVAEIGLDPIETEHRLVTPAILRAIPRRSDEQNKYTAGTVLVVGGSRGLTGAPSLTAEAAFRADAGYVAVAVPDSTLAVFEQRLLEAVKLPCPEEAGTISTRAIEPIAEFASKAGSLALGPGLGRGNGPREVVRRLLTELDRPAVVDADGLHDLEPFERSAPTVLTPHEGELARLLGVQSDWVSAHRLEAVRPRRGELPLRLPAEGRGHARRLSGRGRRPRRLARDAGTGHRRERRRADGDRRRVPRQGRRRAHGRGRGGSGAAARLAGDPAVGRGRERRGGRAAAGARCTGLS